jgi:tetratricopeptide (TPR) repeat protein
MKFLTLQKMQKILSALGALYLISYILVSSYTIFSTSYLGLTNIISHIVLIIAFIGVFGLCFQKRLFNKLFWQEFLFAIFIFNNFNLCIAHKQTIMTDFQIVYTFLLNIPIYFIIYLYSFKSDQLWNKQEDILLTENIKLKILFLLMLYVATALFNPFIQYLPNPSSTPKTVYDYIVLGFNAANSGKLLEQRRYYKKGLKFAKKTGQLESLDVAEIYYNLATYYAARLNDKQALIYYKKSVDLYEKLLDLNKIDKNNKHCVILANAYMAIASKMPINEVNKYEKAIKIFSKIGRFDQICNIYSGIGSEFKDSKDFKKAEYYYKKALAMEKKYNCLDSMASTYNVYADMLNQQKRYKEAELIAKKSVVLYENSKNFPSHPFEGKDNSFFKGNAYIQLAKILANQGRCEEAHKYFKIGYKLEVNGSGGSKLINETLNITSMKECTSKRAENYDY